MVAYIGLATLVLGILFSPYNVQKANAQNGDQLFTDCRSKILELGNRLSEVMDRAPNEDMSAEVQAEVQVILDEVSVVQSDCEPVNDRLSQDPAIKLQSDTFTERLKQLQGQ